MSATASPPNFSRKASASTNATIASPITPAAGTAQTSLRTTAASTGSFVIRSTQRGGETRVQFAVPVHVRPQPGRQAHGNYLEDAAQRVSPFAGGVDRCLHLLLRLAIPTSHPPAPPSPPPPLPP